MTNLARIAELVINQPLMILPEKLAIIAHVLEGRINIDASGLVPTTADAIEVPKPEGSRYVGDFAQNDPSNPRAGRKPYRTTQEGVAIVPVHGSLVNRGGFLDAMSGITSYEKLKFQIAAAAQDADVKSILLDIDSPGGEAVGAFEAADAVRAASKIKPVTALANGLCCSAAYAIATGATKIVTSRSSLSGSIGTVMLHLDRSKQLADQGIKPTLFTAGKRKADGNPFFELSDEVKGELRSYILRVNSLFVNTVAAHRPNLTTEAILAMEAGVFIGPEAVEQGLVDEVGSFETVLSELSGRPAIRSKPARKISMSSEDTFTRAQLDTAVATARTETNAAALTARTAAVAEATKAGAAAERERVKAITTLPEAAGRESQALTMATGTSLSADEAKAILASSLIGGARAGHTGLGLTAEPAKPEDRASMASSWDKALSKNGMKVD